MKPPFTAAFQAIFKRGRYLPPTHFPKGAVRPDRG